jgi:hypothetical protein
MVAEAIDAKSPYTGGHCWRVTVIAQLPQAHVRRPAGRLPARRRRLGSAGDRLLAPRLRQAHHPEYVDKATKLETLHNRIHEIRTRRSARDADIAFWQAAGGGNRAHRRPPATPNGAGSTTISPSSPTATAAARHERGRSGAPRPDRHPHLAAHLDHRLGLSNAELARLPDSPARPAGNRTLLADGPDKVIPAPTTTSLPPATRGASG